MGISGERRVFPYLQNNCSIVTFEDEPTIAAMLNQILESKGREDPVETLSSRYGMSTSLRFDVMELSNLHFRKAR